MQKRPLLKDVFAELGRPASLADRQSVELVLKYHPIFEGEVQQGIEKAVGLYNIGGWGIFLDMVQTAGWFRVQHEKLTREQQQFISSQTETLTYQERYEVEKC